MPSTAANGTAPSPRRLPPEDFELKEIVLHGHRVAYRSAGSGPAIVLVHGITSDSSTWARVMPALAERYTVVAPDLLGHGESAKPRGDYSLGHVRVRGIRDLLSVGLGPRTRHVVGHSLGGGIAMQLAYQFPERCERLVLVGSGGLGREVGTLLKVLSAPPLAFMEYVLPIVLTRAGPARCRGQTIGRFVGRNGHPRQLPPAPGNLGLRYTRLTDARAQRGAFVHTIRAVIDTLGRARKRSATASTSRPRGCRR